MKPLTEDELKQIRIELYVAWKEKDWKRYFDLKAEYQAAISEREWYKRKRTRRSDEITDDSASRLDS